MKRYLILEDGSVFPGVGFGAETVTTGEIVFNTGMSGYQETITDQSYNGQIITFTQPLIATSGSIVTIMKVSIQRKGDCGTRCCPSDRQLAQSNDLR